MELKDKIIEILRTNYNYSSDQRTGDKFVETEIVKVADEIVKIVNTGEPITIIFNGEKPPTFIPFPSQIAGRSEERLKQLKQKCDETN